MTIKRKLLALCAALAAAGATTVSLHAAGSASSAGPVPAMKARLAAKVPVTGMARAGDALVAVGDYGTVVRSTDNGKSWQQAEVPVSSLLTAVHFADAQRGWAVGHGGVVLATTDGGANWTLQQVLDDKPVLLSVYFASAERGYAVGAYGTAWRTEDGGQSWEPMSVGQGRDADLHLNHIFATRKGALYVAAETGLAFRSTDGGDSWTALKPGVSGSLWGGLEAGDDVVLLGMSGRVLASRNGGDSWRAVSGDTEQSLTGAVSTADGKLLVVGAGGVMLRGDASGLNAEVRGDRQNLAAVVLAADGSVVIGGQLGVERLSASTTTSH
ncbi:hypothetical protein dqs_2383 [Azoarcus olearius]|uniref:WD40/YVTN/BNR-like repeat-containing protein n=1 Tax=Azoarcus sp. (strain BH72) TaxID=418699 RepID=UPI0008060C9D|nr:YCF48-related protein [Azoarcus olearius]ANQ85414.1 hypothetical protein dqs_2383 [Azoarcus olearius]